VFLIRFSPKVQNSIW